MADRVDGRVRIIKLRLAFKQALKEPLDPVSKKKRKEGREKGKRTIMFVFLWQPSTAHLRSVSAVQTEPK